jgi:hypothetical protein
VTVGRMLKKVELCEFSTDVAGVGKTMVVSIVTVGGELGADDVFSPSDEIVGIEYGVEVSIVTVGRWLDTDDVSPPSAEVVGVGNETEVSIVTVPPEVLSDELLTIVTVGKFSDVEVEGDVGGVSVISVEDAPSPLDKGDKGPEVFGG